MATQSLTGVLLGKEREFEYRTSRPSALRQCKEDCLREASSRFGVIAQYKDIHFRVKRCTREWGEDEKVTKHVKILVEGDLGSHCHREVVRVLAEDKLEQFVDRVQTRILEGREEKGRTSEGVLKQQQTNSDFVQRNGQPFQAFLDKSGLACYNLEWLAERGSDLHISRNSKLHSKDAQLRRDAKKMGAFVKMLSEDLPFECSLVTHYDWVERSLFSLS